MKNVVRINAPVVPDFVEHKVAAPLKTYLTTLSAFLQREFGRRPEADTALDALYLQSPIGKVYKVTVGDTGTLTTVLVATQ